MEFKNYLPNCSILLWLALHFEAGASIGQIGPTVSKKIELIRPDYFTTYLPDLRV
jgi:hypothetical protein